MLTRPLLWNTPQAALARRFLATEQRTVDRTYINVKIPDFQKTKQDYIAYRFLLQLSGLLILNQIQDLEKLSFGHR